MDNKNKNLINVGLVQMSVVDDLDKNLSTAEEMTRQASRKGADIVVLPEMFCCPYRNEAFVRYREKRGGKIWTTLSAIARENQIYLVGGSMPEDDGEGHIYNSSFIFSPGGDEIGCHRKVHLFDIQVENGQSFMESATFSPGSRLTVVDTVYGKIGVIICFDIRFPELSRLAVLQGAKILIVPAAFNMTTGPAHWEVHFRARAVDNQVFICGCAPAQDPNGSYVSYGNSIVVHPWGNIMARLGFEEGILLTGIDLNDVEKVRKQIPLLKNRRTDLYELKMKE